MPSAILHPSEDRSNAVRTQIASKEPRSMRTYTPSQAVLKESAGVFHWTSEGRRLFDFSSGVLVANLGHNPARWLHRVWDFMGWRPLPASAPSETTSYLRAAPLTAYNAITELEGQASERLCRSLQASPLGKRLQQVMWAASGSEAVQKALWACLLHDPNRNLILATRYGFHGKKGLAGAVTGSETDRERDPRVRFISFPMEECSDLDTPQKPFDLVPYVQELDALWAEHGQKICCLITEPYLGGAGSFHPPAEYLQMLQTWCRDHDVLFILDEVQANFGRTGSMYAFETYGLEPDFICLGKGLGNGVPVSAAVGRKDILESMDYGVASDTWSANPLGCAAVLATLDEFEQTPVLENGRMLTSLFLPSLKKLKETGLVSAVRGEGVVFGIECRATGGQSDVAVANALVRECYLGENGGDGIHLLGPLAKKVIRISPPLTMTREEAETSLALLHRIAAKLASKLEAARTA